jgi:hypothetical protein
LAVEEENVVGQKVGVLRARVCVCLCVCVCVCEIQMGKLMLGASYLKNDLECSKYLLE